MKVAEPKPDKQALFNAALAEVVAATPAGEATTPKKKARRPRRRLPRPGRGDACRGAAAEARRR